MEQVDWRDAMWDIHLHAMDNDVQAELMERAAEEANRGR